jgi:hypothetical protein
LVPVSRLDSTDVEQREPPPAWEPEPLHLPVDAPPPPRGRADDPPDGERAPNVVVIELA